MFEELEKTRSLVVDLWWKVKDLEIRVKEVELTLKNLQKELEKKGVFKLTEKQRKVLEMLSQGLGPSYIAQKMGTSEYAVYGIMKRLREKGALIKNESEDKEKVRERIGEEGDRLAEELSEGSKKL